MTQDIPGSARPASGAAGGGPMSERMQALLSRAAEEQLTEQRQVSAVLADLRGLVAGLSEQLRGTASSARLDALGGDVSSLVAELRRSTTGLGERLEALGRRVDEQASSTSEIVRTAGDGTEAVAVRVTALSGDLDAQSEALGRLTSSVDALAAFPSSLSALQAEVSGLHDRLAPLAELPAALADVGARTGALEALRPEVAAVAQQLQATATGADLHRVRDSLSAALGERLDRLEVATERPSLDAAALQAAVAPALTRLDETARPVLARLTGLDERLTGLEARLGELGSRLTDVGDAAGGVPALATDLAALSGRLDQVGSVAQDVTALRGSVQAMQDDAVLPQVLLALGALSDDVGVVARRVDEVTVPTAEAVALAVRQQVTDRLVDELAPRVADLVLTRVAATLVEQVAGSVTTSVQEGLAERVRAANADSERRIGAHVDEAVLALAEALLRRKRGGRPPIPELPGDLTVPAAAAPPLPGPPRDAQEDSPPEPEAAPAPAAPAAPDVEPDVEPDVALEATRAAPGKEAAAQTDPEAADPEQDHDAPADVAAPAEAMRQADAQDEPTPVEHQQDAAEPQDASVAQEVATVEPSPVEPETAEPGQTRGFDDEEPVSIAEREAPDEAPDEAEHETPDEAPDGDGAPGPAAAAGPPAAPSAGSRPAAGGNRPASLIDSSPAPASAFRQFTMPRTTAGEPPSAPAGPPAAPAGARAPGPSGPAVAPLAAAQPGNEWYDDEDEDGPRRRPWWRPGG